MKKWMGLVLALALCLALCAAALGEAERTEAAEFAFELAAEETLYLENLIFNEPVTVSGDYGQIMFANCVFNADVINTADVYTRVFILPDCEINGNLILRNSVKEATLETALPKFITYVPAPVVSEDCVGVVVALGTFDVEFNAETYHLTDSTLFYDGTHPENGMVPYQGQEANLYMVGQWWENGEKTILVECEYDPEM